MSGGGGENSWSPVYDSASDLYFKLYKTAPASVQKINIEDSWKIITAQKINIGDVWKSIVHVKINIGDVWKDIL